MRAASSSKTAMNSLPMMRRFCSGSVTPASFARKRCDASTASRFRPSLSSRFCRTLANSFLRSTPLLTKTQLSRSPRARCTSVAATAESTPPDNAQIARPRSPAVARTWATVASMKCRGVQSALAPQMPNTKLRRMLVPCCVWCTSGWNCTAHIRRCGSSMAARALAVFATWRKPLGSSSASSPCDIHTVSLRGTPSNSPEPLLISTSARPYSRLGAGFTFPPSLCARNCRP